MNTDDMVKNENSIEQATPAVAPIAVHIAPDKLPGGLCLAVGWMVEHNENYYIELKEDLYNLQQPAGPFVVYSQWGQDGTCLSMDVKLR